MPQPTITLTLPQAVYDHLQQQAQRHQRPIEDEATLVLAATVASEGELPAELQAAIAALATLDDATLWRASQSQPTVEDGLLLDMLIEKRQREGLTATEEALLAETIDRHDRVMVLRAEAVALLAERGLDVRARAARA